MKRAVIKKKNNRYVILCKKTNEVLIKGKTEKDCLDFFYRNNHRKNLPDYGLYRRVDSR